MNTNDSHIATVKTLVAVFLALLALTALTTGVANIDFGAGSTLIALAIAGLKRFACDHGAPAELPEKLPVTFDEKVAIVGGGPAGAPGAAGSPRARGSRRAPTAA